MSELKQGVNLCIESRALPDGKGGIFTNGELICIFDTEAQSDSAALAVIRHMVVAGLIEQKGDLLKDDKPIDLFDMTIR